MISGSEAQIVWEFVGKVGVGIGVLVALIKGCQYLFSLMPVSKLEQRVVKIEEHDAKDFEHFAQLDNEVEGLKREVFATNDKIRHIDESIQQIGKSQISLLRHFAHGNGQAEMEKEADELTEYFIRRE